MALLRSLLIGRIPLPLFLWPTAALWALGVVVWLLSVTVGDSGRALARGLVAACLIATALALLRIAAGLLTAADRYHRRRGAILLTLLGLALITAIVGVDHEVGSGYYLDEGHYLHHANRINSGQLLSGSFVYPHLLYYLDAFALWVASQFPGALAHLGALFGVVEPRVLAWLVLRLVAAILGALTAVPVFLLAERIGGLWAGTAAACLTIFSALFSKGFSVNTSDVPSAFFAAVCFLLAGRLLERETVAGYLLAGMAAGLAAGTKYPAGVVALAIVGSWIFQRVRTRTLSFGLLWAGLAAIVTFLATTPSLIAFPDLAMAGRGLFFGVRQYSQGGWIGVMPASNTAFYGRLLLQDLGLPAVILAALGLLVAGRAVRVRMLSLLLFPVAFFALICSMRMVVVRNLFPLIPALAVLVGVAASAAAGRLVLRARRGPTLAAASLLLAVVAVPATRTLSLRVGLARPSTREMMVSWVLENLPRGSLILKESYTPNFPRTLYPTQKIRFAARLSEEEMRQGAHDFLLLAQPAYQRFTEPENLVKEHHHLMAERYQKIFDTFQLELQISPGRFRQGPELKLFRLEPRPLLLRSSRTFRPREAFAPGVPVLGDGPGQLRFNRGGRFAVFKEFFDAGLYRLRMDSTETSRALVEVRDLNNREIAAVRLAVEGATTLELPEAGKYFFYLRAARGSRVASLRVKRVEALPSSDRPPSEPGGHRRAGPMPG